MPAQTLQLRRPSTSLRGALEVAFPVGAFSVSDKVHRPSGLATIPRPYVIRAEQLRDKLLAPEQPFFFYINCFQIDPDRALFVDAVHNIAQSGLGPDRVPCVLGSFTWRSREFLLRSPTLTESSILTIHFDTPLEFRSALPEFSTLIARLRDRISSLQNFYCGTPLSIDFANFTTIARSVCLQSHNLTARESRRHSTRTGQWHPLNGVTGSARYEGPWRSYEDWLRLGEYTGVGRQTSFGKGQYYLAESP